MRWYHSQNRIADALDVLRTVAKWNGNAFPEDVTLKRFQKEQVESTERKGSYIDFFKRKNLTKTLTLCFMW